MLLSNHEFFLYLSDFTIKAMIGTSCIRNWRVDQYDGCAVDLFPVYDI